ncbi:MAG: histidine kinase, partial [Candidatus Thiodiazotropha sp.]
MSVAKKNSERYRALQSQLPVVIKSNSQQRKSPASSSAVNEEEERKRLSRELHDGLGQLLTTIGLQVRQCLDHCDSTPLPCPSPQEHKASLQQISEMVKEAIGEVRSICSAIRPAILDDLGVLAAIS